MIREPILYEELIAVVTKWSPTLRLNLIQDIVRSLEPEMVEADLSSGEKPVQTLEHALGLLETNGPAPSDDEIKQILADARIEKYR